MKVLMLGKRGMVLMEWLKVTLLIVLWILENWSPVYCSRLPTISAFVKWVAFEMQKVDTRNQVTSYKLWRQVGESFRPPKTCATVSWTFRGFYEALLDYERHKTKGGELNVPITSHSEPMNIENQSLLSDKCIQASASGRARRDAVARAMQGWHSQCLLGNGELIIRSHEGPDAREKRDGFDGMAEGYTIDHIVDSGKLVTLFSAPDYPQFQATEERYNNKGAYVVLEPPSFDNPIFHGFAAVTPRPKLNAYYDYEEVIDSDGELDLASMVTA